MTRFGVMKHLRILEAAGLVTARKVGREKRHYLNPVPIRLIHDRWVSKYTGPMAAALIELKSALEGSAVGAEAVVQVYQIVIRTTPERLWRALTESSFARRYPFYMNIDSTFEPGAPIRFVNDKGVTAVEGEILESDPPRRLVYTWVIRYDAKFADEVSRVTWEIKTIGAPGDSLCQLTATHDVTNAPLTASHVVQGWSLILSGIKTLLETGEALIITRNV